MVVVEFIKDLKRHTRLAVAWDRHGSPVSRWRSLEAAHKPGGTDTGPADSLTHCRAGFGDIYSVQLSVTPTDERTCVTDTCSIFTEDPAQDEAIRGAICVITIVGPKGPTWKGD